MVKNGLLIDRGTRPNLLLCLTFLIEQSDLFRQGLDQWAISGHVIPTLLDHLQQNSDLWRGFPIFPFNIKCDWWTVPLNYLILNFFWPGGILMFLFCLFLFVFVCFVLFCFVFKCSERFFQKNPLFQKRKIKYRSFIGLALLIGKISFGSINQNLQ